MKNKEIIKQLILQATADLGVVFDDSMITFSNEFSKGDYSSNIAFRYAKNLGMSPKDLSEKIVKNLEQNGLPDIIDRIEPVAGFINFYFSAKYFNNQAQEIVNLSEDFGRSDIHKGKKILIEHSSPNLFKPFHIGHLMNNTIGESIVRLAEFSGAEVSKISYPSDVSLGIGKAIYALMHGDQSKLDSLNTLQEKVSFLGECYVSGTNTFKENESIHAEVRAITQKIFDSVDGPELELYRKCKDLNLAYFKEVVGRLGSRFDDFIFESEAGKEGEKLVRANIPNIFENSDGAVIYKGEGDGLHTRVFINKEGYPTYEAKDVGLLSLKFKKYNPDISIFVTDVEQKAYFEVVSTAAGKINPDWKNKTIHRTHGRMSFKGQKMSSRLGGVPLATSTIEAVSEDVKERAPELDALNIETISIGAVKFSILRVTAGKNINFDPETSLSFEGGSGPYLQYTAVRAQSVVSKAVEAGLSMDDASFDNERKVYDVERALVHFPEVVELAINEWAPHHIVMYLLDLSQAFNGWYANTKIIDNENPLQGYNLLVVKAVNQTIKNGLQLLGMETPTSM